MPKTMRVGICGAGPAGLTLAAILSREAEAGAIELKVFERGVAQRDQGSGWDMSKAALEALSRAGVEPSTVQRPGSDTMRFYRTGGSRPDVCLRLPSYLKRWGVKKEDVGLDQMNLETERNLIIGGLIAQLGSEVVVQHNTNVCAARRKGNGVELLGANQEPLGDFDLVVDASGVHSHIRGARFTHSADAFYTGVCLLQGVLRSPEDSLAPEIVSRLGEGSFGIFGPTPSGEGVIELFIQRYGAAHDNKVANVNINVPCDDPNALAARVGLSGVHGVSSDPEQLEAVKRYYKQSLAHPDWPQCYRELFDAIEAVRLLPVFMHPMAELVIGEHGVVDGSDSLCFVGVGDALHALPPWSGTSGNFAMQDSADLATALLQLQKQEQGWCTESLARTVRECERAFLQRADEPRLRCINAGERFKDMLTTRVKDYDYVLSHIAGEKSMFASAETFFIVSFLKTLTWLNRFENYGL